MWDGYLFLSAGWLAVDIRRMIHPNRVSSRKHNHLLVEMFAPYERTWGTVGLRE